MEDQPNQGLEEGFLLLAAIGLSHADSKHRKNLRGRDLRRNPFKHLPGDIRVEIYEYLTYPPLEKDVDIEEHHSARNLALTCRQAKQEWDDECHRRFWIYLTQVQNLHLAETDLKLSFPEELTSKHDLLGVDSLKVIINGPFLASGEDVPQAFFRLFELSLKELVFHYNGITGQLPTFMEVRYAFLRLCAAVKQKDFEPQRITFSWNRQAHAKQQVDLSGRTFELCDKEKNNIRWSVPDKYRIKRTLWPTFKVLFSEDMSVGSMQLSQGSKGAASRAGFHSLMEGFHLLNNLHDQGNGTLKTHQILSTYVVAQDD